MTNIVPFAGNINGQEVQAVNARDLHEFLEVPTRFNDWFVRRVSEYGFEEGKDFCSFLSKTNSGGRPTKEYHISVDMAKELSMVERNAKGKEARKYFIECEKVAKAPLTALDYTDPNVVLGVISALSEEAEKAKALVIEFRPKAEAYNQLLNADGLYGLQNAARALAARPNLFIQWLKRTFLFYQGNALVPRVQYIQRGLFEVKTTIVDDKVRPKTFITPKGLDYFRNKVPSELLVGNVA
ncbi:MAG: antA/AntB antirepressor family protein [Rhodobacteraceae bacterium]|nr:antA/AntB antirepressor family protein [Paracoccaceae bacterium]